MNHHDVFLRWLSVRGAGSWDTFRSSHAWLFGSQVKPTWTARSLQELGHLEIDWEARRWAIGPPALVVLPESGLQATLVGCRPASLSALAESIEDRTEIDVVVQCFEQRAPTAIYFTAGGWTHLEAVAADLGIAFEARLTRTLAAALTPDQPVTRDGPRRGGVNVLAFEPASLGWVRDRRVDDPSAPGLFRYPGFGGLFQHVWSDGRGWADVNLDIGRYLDLRRVGRHVLEHRRDGENGRLSVLVGAPLPMAQARVAATASGLAPWPVGDRVVYENVPLKVAQQIADSLGQRLT